MTTLFLSYAGADRAIATALKEGLIRAGFDHPLWQDIDQIRGGDNWLITLEEALRDCSGYVIVVGLGASIAGCASSCTRRSGAILNPTGSSRCFRCCCRVSRPNPCPPSSASSKPKNSRNTQTGRLPKAGSGLSAAVGKA